MLALSIHCVNNVNTFSPFNNLTSTNPYRDPLECEREVPCGDFRSTWSCPVPVSSVTIK